MSKTNKSPKQPIADILLKWVSIAAGIASIFAVLISLYALKHSLDLETHKKHENLVVRAQRVFDDYPTKLHAFSSRGGHPIGGLTVYWDLLVSNNGDSTVSITGYEISLFEQSGGTVSTYSGLNEGIYDVNLRELRDAIMINPGGSRRFYIKSQIILHHNAFQFAWNKYRNSNIDSIINLLDLLYANGIDFYGNAVLQRQWGENKYTIIQPEGRKEQIFRVKILTGRGGGFEDLVSWYSQSGIN